MKESNRLLASVAVSSYRTVEVEKEEEGEEESKEEEEEDNEEYELGVTEMKGRNA